MKIKALAGHCKPTLMKNTNHWPRAIGKHARKTKNPSPKPYATRKPRPAARPLPKSTLLGVLLAGAAGPCAAATWTGDTDHDWFTGDNWSTKTPPTAADDVLIDTGEVRVSGGAAESAGATIRGTAEVTVIGTGSSWTAQDVHLRGATLNARNGGALNAQHFSSAPDF